VSSAELYTATSYRYGRVEARVRFAAGDGVVSSFFLWKDGSELPGTFWNELDFEKLGAACYLETNAFYGNPAVVHAQRPALSMDLCGAFHVYAYEWTPDYIAWLVDGMQVRRETTGAATAFAENATMGMQIRFNVWPGDATFGGNFSAEILPVHQYIDWVQYSSYANGDFLLEWREDFDEVALPSGWLTASWSSPKNLSTHDPRNVNVVGGYAVLSLTADDAVGPAGAMPEGTAGSAGSAGAAGSPSAAGSNEANGCGIMPGRSGRTNALLGPLTAAVWLALGRVRRAPRRRHPACGHQL
jgi:beta-glucanase (GH16 family)